MSEHLDEASPVKRGPGRPPMRAAAHVSSEREPVHQRRRRHKLLVNQDKFYIPVDEIPEGSSYEWKRWSVYGQEDPFYLANLREQGWQPVDPKKHPNWLPEGYNQNVILKDGMILMERPMELTQEFNDEISDLNRRQLRDQQARLGQAPEGTAPRKDANKRDLASIKTEMVRQMVVDE